MQFCGSLASPSDAVVLGRTPMGQASVAGMLAQLELFAGLAVPELQPGKRWSRKTKGPASPLFEQLAFDLRPPPVWVDPDDIPEEGDFPEHRWARAEDCETPKIRGVASVFDLAARQVIAEFMLPRRRAQQEVTNDAPVIHRRIVREGDVTRHIAMRVQDTDEWKERETARRARQVLPKPPRQTFKLRKKEAA